ncbi:MAG: recombination mediator RecR [Acidobacteriota bacterium]
MREDGPGPVETLIAELSRLPSIGRKTAQRLAFYLLKAPQEQAERLAAAITRVRSTVRPCSICHNLTHRDPCALCRDERRQDDLLCVVEEGLDVEAIERTGRFHGRYHVLGGALSPLDGIGPDELHLDDLVARVKRSDAREVIVATNPTVEGEATAAYLARLLKPLGVVVSRIASGIPVGGDLEYADEVTMARALEGRSEL